MSGVRGPAFTFLQSYLASNNLRKKTYVRATQFTTCFMMGEALSQSLLSLVCNILSIGRSPRTVGDVLIRIEGKH